MTTRCLSKSKYWYSNRCLHLLKHAVPLKLFIGVKTFRIMPFGITISNKQNATLRVTTFSIMAESMIADRKVSYSALFTFLDGCLRHEPISIQTLGSVVTLSSCRVSFS